MGQWPQGPEGNKYNPVFLQPASCLFKFSQWADIGQHVPREYCTYVSVSGKNVTMFQAKGWVCVCVCEREREREHKVSLVKELQFILFLET